jgi:MoaA/NifB/PqqE/SkfB family radical SAM enzyme
MALSQLSHVQETSMSISHATTILKHAPVVSANGLNLLRQYAHIKTGVRLARPSMIYATIAERCNLRCKYCYSWKESGDNELSTEDWLRAFDELLNWVKHPKLNISGGEPFMRKDIFEILEFVIKKGALTGVVTNGYTMTPQMAPRVVALGLTNLNISIDSLDAEVFDFMRAEGRESHTKRVVTSIRRVMEEVHKQKSNTKVFLKTVVCGHNAESLVPLVRFVEENHMAGIIFQPLQDVFGNQAPDLGDQWHKHTVLWPKDPEPLAAAARQLIKLKQEGSPIMNTVSQLATWEAYFRDPIQGVSGQLGGRPEDSSDTHVPCRIGHTHLYFAANGDMQLCWDYSKIGNIKTDSVRKTWHSEKAELLRAKLAQCTQPCTVSCLLDRGMKETVSAFVQLMGPNNHKRTAE